MIPAGEGKMELVYAQVRVECTGRLRGFQSVVESLNGGVEVAGHQTGLREIEINGWTIGQQLLGFGPLDQVGRAAEHRLWLSPNKRDLTDGKID
jgi:hypothetical protein